MSAWNKAKNYLLKKLLTMLELQNRLTLKPGSFVHDSVRMKGARIYGLVEINEGCKIMDDVRIHAGCKVTIGRFTSLNGPNMDIQSKIYPVSIGSFCSIARNVSIQEFNHRYDGLTTYYIHRNVFNEDHSKDTYSHGPIVIGNDVWIGTQCVITSGAKIGNGVVVAANSVVIGEIPPYAIVAGSPAKVLKFRFSESKIAELQSQQWWDWSIEKIKQMKHLFDNN